MFLTQNKILLIKREAVYGTDSAPTVAANAVDAKGIKIDYQYDVLPRDIVRNTLSPVAPIIGQRSVEISFMLEIKWSGTKGTVARLSDALVACGLAETVSAGSSVIYKPTDVAALSATIWLYELQDTGNCRLHKITGAMGTPSLVIENGKIAGIELKFQGIANDPTEAAAPATPTWETVIPPICESATLTLNSVALIAQSLKIDLNNEIVKRDDLNSAAGLKGFALVGRKPSGSINPEAVLAATYDFYADFKAATSRALSIVIGTAAGNKLTITAPKLVIDKLGNADRGGIGSRDVGFELVGNTGGDELQLKFE